MWSLLELEKENIPSYELQFCQKLGCIKHLKVSLFVLDYYTIVISITISIFYILLWHCITIGVSVTWLYKFYKYMDQVRSSSNIVQFVDNDLVS